MLDLDEETIDLLRQHRQRKTFIADTRAAAQAAIDHLNAQLGQAALEQLDLEAALRARGVDLDTEIPDPVEGD